MYNQTKQKAKIRLLKHYVTDDSRVPLFTNQIWLSLVNHHDFAFYNKVTWKRIKLLVTHSLVMMGQL